MQASPRASSRGADERTAPASRRRPSGVVQPVREAAAASRERDHLPLRVPGVRAGVVAGGLHRRLVDAVLTRILVGGALERLRELPDESVHCVVTSPPYWGLRSYEKDPGMIGLEPTFDEHLERLVAVFREVRRVLRSDGTLWLNYGDAYASTLGGGSARYRPQAERRMKRDTEQLKAKDLMMMPARVALALQADGWWVRSKVIWHKPNPMPESCTDRPTSSYEELFLMSKHATYFYDAEAVRVPAAWPEDKPRIQFSSRRSEAIGVEPSGNEAGKVYQRPTHANLRNVWTIPTHSFALAHFATFPPALVEPCIRAGTSERGVCAQCGAPWVRKTDTRYVPAPGWGEGSVNGRRDGNGEQKALKSRPRLHRETETTGWRPSCECAHDTVPATVLDPFGGSGTVALVAQRLQRDAVLIEISPTYAEMAEKRIREDAPLFADVTVGTAPAPAAAYADSDRSTASR